MHAERRFRTQAQTLQFLKTRSIDVIDIVERHLPELMKSDLIPEPLEELEMAMAEFIAAYQSAAKTLMEREYYLDKKVAAL